MEVEAAIGKRELACIPDNEHPGPTTCRLSTPYSPILQSPVLDPEKKHKATVLLHLNSQFPQWSLIFQS